MFFFCRATATMSYPSSKTWPGCFRCAFAPPSVGVGRNGHGKCGCFTLAFQLGYGRCNWMFFVMKHVIDSSLVQRLEDVRIHNDWLLHGNMHDLLFVERYTWGVNHHEDGRYLHHTQSCERLMQLRNVTRYSCTAFEAALASLLGSSHCYPRHRDLQLTTLTFII